ncbi:PAAR domain-containing protein [Telmatospirillum sp.]|uniref:PAAR domain-containing protein n=1 Tax=Telmatospirillum sp. TaxID=2079197 RepID=UPI00284B335E|nr:PAAR domain-containing protein [Telmatospirillum sp.]MDR3438944.1 PAAR domain-containing protein [Telmatospirillum sp.]
MPAVARLGDASSHGGTIISASSNLIVNGKGVARAEDLHSCPLKGHGVTALASSSTLTNGGKSLVRVGDQAGCGAVITEGSPNVSAA